MARNDCKNAMPSLPWLSAKAHSDGFWISDQEMSLFTVSSETHPTNQKDSPGLGHVLADVFRPAVHLQPSVFGKLDILGLRAERRQQHAVCISY